MKTFKYWIEPRGHMYGLRHEDHEWAAEEVFGRIAACCQLRFERWTRESNAHMKYIFRTGESMRNSGGTPLSALYNNGYIAQNTTRKIRFDIGVDWQLPQLTGHEFAHYISPVLDDRRNDPDDGHHSDLTHILNAGLSRKCIGINPVVVLALQKRYRSTTTIFYPRDKQVQGNVLRAERGLYSTRNKLLADRDVVESSAEMQAKQKEVLANLKEIVTIHPKARAAGKEWHRLKQTWRNVPKAG